MSSFSLENHIVKLEAIETYFSNPDIKLDVAMKKHAEALQIAKEIMEYLDKSEQSIRAIDINDLLNNNLDN